MKHLSLFVCLTATAAFAQGPKDIAAARAQYQQEMTACATAKPAVGDHNNCAKEARHALAEIKRGRMDASLTATDYAKNALQRCEAHKGEDKADCIARIQGQGRIEGSVAGGGILRELTTTKVIAAPTVAAPAPRKDAEAERPSGLMSNCRWVPPTDWVCK